MMMSRDKIEDKLEELIAASRLNELLNKKEAEEEKKKAAAANKAAQTYKTVSLGDISCGSRSDCLCGLQIFHTGLSGRL